MPQTNWNKEEYIRAYQMGLIQEKQTKEILFGGFQVREVGSGFYPPYNRTITGTVLHGNRHSWSNEDLYIYEEPKMKITPTLPDRTICPYCGQLTWLKELACVHCGAPIYG